MTVHVDSALRPGAGTGSRREYGTRLLRTTVVSHPEGDHSWHRTPGADAPAGFAPLALSRTRGVVALGDPAPGRLAAALGEPDGSGRRYRAGSGVSLAEQLLTDQRDEASTTRLLHDLGALLAALHRLEPPAGCTARPRAMNRLGLWLEPTVAPAAARPIRQVLGQARWQTVRAWFRELADHPAVMLHGAPGLGSLVPAGELLPPVLLTGEDLSVGPAGWDLGWVTGELVELGWQLRLGASTLGRWLGALSAGYGCADVTTGQLRAAVLRILLHVSDFETFTRGEPRAVQRYGHFLAHLIDQGAQQS